MNPGAKLYILHMGESLPPAVRSDWERLVDAERLERIRAHKHPIDADRSLAGEALARYALARELRRVPSSIDFVRAPSGKPRLVPPSGRATPLCHSISHSGPLVVCAVAGSPVGVDAEVKAIPEKIIPWFCHPNERELLVADPAPARLRLRLWALKESWVKCLETGAGRNMAVLDLADAVAGTGGRDVSFVRAGCAFRSLFVGEAAVAVCVLAG